MDKICSCGKRNPAWYTACGYCLADLPGHGAAAKENDMYTLIILVDGQKISSNINATLGDVEALCELQGPALWDFNTSLRLTGSAVDAHNDGYGTVVTVAHKQF